MASLPSQTVIAERPAVVNLFMSHYTSAKQLEEIVFGSPTSLRPNCHASRTGKMLKCR
jgi:hypothetical protein